MLPDIFQTDLQQAQLRRDELKINTLRLLLSEIHNAEIAKGEKLSEEEILRVLQKEIKKRKEASEGFRQGGREESAKKEEAEAEILAKYLPAQLSDEELNEIIDEVISKIGAISLVEMGKVMGMVMDKVAGRAEGGRVNALVRLKIPPVGRAGKS